MEGIWGNLVLRLELDQVSVGPVPDTVGATKTKRLESKDERSSSVTGLYVEVGV